MIDDLLTELWDARRDIFAGVVVVAIVCGLIFGGMTVAPMGPIAMVVGFGMLVAGSALAVCVPFIW